MVRIITISMLILSIACSSPVNDPPAVFGKPQKVTLIGYSGNSMEPSLSRDGSILFFNNLNSSPENTNLHWSTRINDSTFQYKGELSGANTSSLEAVASMDLLGNFYFVSDRDYPSTLASIFTSNYSNGAVTSVTHVDGLSKNIAGWINFDVEVNAGGTMLYMVDGRYDQNGGPYEADLVTAAKTSTGFQRMSLSADPMRNLNTSALEYAACISSDNLEFYFTRVAAPLTSTSIPEIFRTTRTSVNDAFGASVKIESITGFAEAPTITPDGKILYYHKKENGVFVIYLVKKV